MIVGKDVGGFLRDFFSRASAQAFLLQDFSSEAGEPGGLEALLVRYLSCEKKSFCKKCAGCVSDSPFDLHVYEGDALAIKEAREIQWSANQSGFGGSKIFLIKNKYIAPDAESTLLKTIEEPHPDTYFILSSVSELALSRPLLSRLTLLRRTGGGDWRAAKFKFTLESVPALSQERGDAEEAFQKIELWAEEALFKSNSENLDAITLFIEDLYETKRRFFEKTYPPRMLLEYLAISKYYLGYG